MARLYSVLSCFFINADMADFPVYLLCTFWRKLDLLPLLYPPFSVHSQKTRDSVYRMKLLIQNIQSCSHQHGTKEKLAGETHPASGNFVRLALLCL